MVAYSFKRRFVSAIKLGLGGSVTIGPDEDPFMRPKRQTIRAVGKRRHARAGETLQLYHGMRSSDCFKIGEARCTKVSEIRLYIHSEWIEIKGESELRKGKQLDAFARDGGFEDWAAMRAFEEHGSKQLGPFVGLLIQWETL